MDITDEYLKMILALPEEFFDGWKWKEGDQFLRYNHECKYVEIQGHVGNYALYSYTGKICNINETGDYVEGDLRPVPSQEQLQKMSGISAFTFIHMLHSFSEDQLQYGNKIPYDINCITLAFLVNLKYNYIWDGEKWI